MYIIKKDGLYLMGYRYTGIEEMLEEGKVSDVLTAMWGNNKRDARLFESKTFAMTLTEMFGGEIIKTPI